MKNTDCYGIGIEVVIDMLIVEKIKDKVGLIEREEYLIICPNCKNAHIIKAKSGSQKYCKNCYKHIPSHKMLESCQSSRLYFHKMDDRGLKLPSIDKFEPGSVTLETIEELKTVLEKIRENSIDNFMKGE